MIRIPTNQPVTMQCRLRVLNGAYLATVFQIYNQSCSCSVFESLKPLFSPPVFEASNIIKQTCHPVSQRPLTSWSPGVFIVNLY